MIASPHVASRGATMPDWLRRLLVRAMPWYDTSARDRRSEQVVAEANRAIDRVGRTRDSYTDASRRLSR